MLFSVIGAYYYLRVVKLMYFDEPKDQPALQASGALRFVLSVNGLAVLLLGVFPGLLLALCARVLPSATQGIQSSSMMITGTRVTEPSSRPARILDDDIEELGALRHGVGNERDQQGRRRLSCGHRLAAFRRSIVLASQRAVIERAPGERDFRLRHHRAGARFTRAIESDSLTV